MKIESRIGRSRFPEEKIYNFLGNFNNFRQFLPEEKVKNWESTEESCSFEVQPLGRTGLQIVEKEPYKLIKISTDPAYSKYNLSMWIQIKTSEPGDTRIKLTAEPHINPMLAGMIQGQVKLFLDKIVDRIETFDFTQPS